MSIEQQPAPFKFQVAGPWLILNRAGVLRYIAASEACFAAGICFKLIHVDALAGDVMAGAGGAVAPAPDVQHQIPDKEILKYCNYSTPYNHAGSIVVKAAGYYVQYHEFESSQQQFLLFTFHVHRNVKLYMPCMYLVNTWFGHVCTRIYMIGIQLRTRLHCPCNMYVLHYRTGIGHSVQTGFMDASQPRNNLFLDSSYAETAII